VRALRDIGQFNQYNTAAKEASMRRLLTFIVIGFLMVAVARAQGGTPVFLMAWGQQGTREGQFNAPEGIAVDGEGNVYVADTENHRVQKFDANGKFLLQWGSKGANNGQFESPSGIALDKENNVYVADTFNHRIQKFDKNGRFLGKWGTPCELQSGKGCVDPDGPGPLQPGDGQFNLPAGIAFDQEGNLYVTDAFNHRVQKFSPTGKFLGKFGVFGTGDGQFNITAGIALDKDGNIYVSDNKNDRVQKFDPMGKFLGRLDAPMRRPYHLAVDKTNRIYVVDQGNNRIQVFDATGKLLLAWGKEGAAPGEFQAPKGIAIFQNFIYIADSDNHRIQKFEWR
jgi:tripartite motif-containing protein 71